MRNVALVFGVVQEYVPSLASLVAIVVHESPPLVEYFRVIGFDARFVSLIDPLFHVMLCTLPHVQYVHPFGDVSVLDHIVGFVLSMFILFADITTAFLPTRSCAKKQT